MTIAITQTDLTAPEFRQAAARAGDDAFYPPRACVGAGLERQVAGGGTEQWTGRRCATGCIATTRRASVGL